MSTHTAPPPVPVSPGVRVSDAEREETVARLHEALGEGRLDLSETGTRVGDAYAARYRDELTVLLADLPSPTVRLGDGAAPGWSLIWESLVWRARTIVWGAGTSRPAPTHRRTAALLVGAALLWFLVWALVGAAMVAA